MVQTADRMDFDGLSGVVSEHVPAQPRGLRGRRSYDRRLRAQPRPVQKADPALSAASPPVGIWSILSRRAPVVVTEPTPEAQSGLEMTTAGEELSRGTRVTMSTPAGTGRLRVVVQLDGKTRLEVEAREEEWSIASGLGRSEEQAADWAVARGINRALNKPRGETARLQPILNGDLVVGEHRPGSWESLAAFVRKGGAYRLIPLLRGGMDPATQDSRQGCVLGPNLDGTPTRLAELQSVLTKAGGGIGSIPTGVPKDWFKGVRLNLIEEKILIDVGNDQTINRHPQPDVVVQAA